MPTTAVEVLHEDGRWYLRQCSVSKATGRPAAGSAASGTPSTRDAVPAGGAGRPVPQASR